MKSIGQPYFKFRPFIVLFTVFFTTVFIFLGFWQIHRYHYKKTLIENYYNTLKQSPITIEKLLTLSNKDFQPVQVKGYYLNNDNILLQNKSRNGQPGVDVITPFRLLNDTRVVLINRGWISQEKLKKGLQPVKGGQSVHGYVKPHTKKPFILGKNIYNKEARPLPIQRVDTKTLSTILGVPLEPFIIRLSPEEPYGFNREWIITSMMPARHMGYAIQWFAMAFALVILFFVFSRKEAKK